MIQRGKQYFLFSRFKFRTVRTCKENVVNPMINPKLKVYEIGLPTFIIIFPVEIAMDRVPSGKSTAL